MGYEEGYGDERVRYGRSEENNATRKKGKSNNGRAWRRGVLRNFDSNRDQEERSSASHSATLRNLAAATASGDGVVLGKLEGGGSVALSGKRNEYGSRPTWEERPKKAAGDEKEEEAYRKERVTNKSASEDGEDDGAGEGHREQHEDVLGREQRCQSRRSMGEGRAEEAQQRDAQAAENWTP